MAINDIYLGAAANDGTGDPLRVGGSKINANFDFINTRFKKSLYDKFVSKTVNAVSDFNITNGLSDKFYLFKTSSDGHFHFASKVGNVESFVNSRLYFPQSNEKVYLGDKSSETNGYNEWDLGTSLSNILDNTKKQPFQSWFHVGEIQLPTSKYLIDGNPFDYVPLPTNSSGTPIPGEVVRDGWISDGAGGFDYVKYMYYDGSGDPHNSNNWTIIDKI